MRKDYNYGGTRLWKICGDNILSRLHTIPCSVWRISGRTDVETDLVKQRRVPHWLCCAERVKNWLHVKISDITARRFKIAVTISQTLVDGWRNWVSRVYALDMIWNELSLYFVAFRSTRNIFVWYCRGRKSCRCLVSRQWSLDFAEVMMTTMNNLCDPASAATTSAACDY